MASDNSVKESETTALSNLSIQKANRTVTLSSTQRTTNLECQLREDERFALNLADNLMMA